MSISSGSADTSGFMTQSVVFPFSLPRCLQLVLLMSTSVCCCYSHLKIYYSGAEGAMVGSSCSRVKVSSSFTALVVHISGLKQSLLVLALTFDTGIL